MGYVLAISALWAITLYFSAGNRHTLRWACCLAASYAVGVTWTLAVELVPPGFNVKGLSWMDLHKLVSITIDAGITLWVFHAAKSRWEYVLERAIAVSLVPSFAAFIGAISPMTHAVAVEASNVVFIAILLSGRLGRGDAQDYRRGTIGHFVRGVALAAQRKRDDTPWTTKS